MRKMLLTSLVCLGVASAAFADHEIMDTTMQNDSDHPIVLDYTTFVFSRDGQHQGSVKHVAIHSDGEETLHTPVMGDDAANVKLFVFRASSIIDGENGPRPFHQMFSEGDCSHESAHGLHNNLVFSVTTDEEGNASITCDNWGAHHPVVDNPPVQED